MVEMNTEAVEVTVVNPSGVDLAGKLGECWEPAAPAGIRLARDRFGLHPSLHLDSLPNNLDRSTAGFGGSRLLPSAVPAGGRAPFRHPSTGQDRELSTAPAADDELFRASGEASLGDGLLAVCGHHDVLLKRFTTLIVSLQRICRIRQCTRCVVLDGWFGCWSPGLWKGGALLS
jgi:hypothetical protein